MIDNGHFREASPSKISKIRESLRSVLSSIKEKVSEIFSILFTMHGPRRSRLRSRYMRQKLIMYGLIGLGICIVVGLIGAFALFAWYARDLPSPGKLTQVSNNSTVFYDRDGKIIYEMYKDKNRVPVGFKDISDNLKKATVAIEDKHFYEHRGISETGILRAFLSSIFLGRRQGGSTITQQLIKTVLLDSQQTISRKIKEALLAEEVERRYSKDQILEMYLNEAPYGGTYWGVGSAARGYFNKDPKDLNLVESAILAGLPQWPSHYSPFIGKKDAWKGRTKDVLRRMREDGYITKAQETDALKQLDSVKFANPQLNISAAHFVFYVKKLLEDQYGPKIMDQGLKIKTTLSLDIQKKVEDIVKKEIDGLKDYDVTNGAAVILDSQTGEILAYVGSHDFNDEKNGQFDVASQGLRQPGSTLKPIEYAVAFEKGYTPSTVIMDVKTIFANQGQQDYIPQNYDGKFRGPVQIRYALANSLNVPAVKMTAMIGLYDFLKKANDMGLTDLAPTDKNMANLGLSASLGGGATKLIDLTGAYTVFAHGGIKTELQAIKEVTDYKGKTIYKSNKPKEKRVLSPEVSYLISSILSDDDARSDTFGHGSMLKIGAKTVAVKTGTTNDKRDNYTVGFTKSVTVGVWVGNNDNSVMNPRIASGVTGASPIWHNIMVELLKKYPDGIMDKPDKVKEVEIDKYLGGLPHNDDPKKKEFFIEGTEPKDISPFYKKIKISRAQPDKLANDVEIKSGNYDEKEYIVFTEKDPVSNDGKNRWQEAIDEWVKGQGDSKFHPPTDTSDASKDDVVVSIKDPDDKQQVNNNHVDILFYVVSGDPVKNVKVYINNNEIKSIDGNQREYKLSTDLSDGSYELKVVGVNEKDKRGESVIRFGVNKPWDYQPATPTPAPTSVLTITVIPTPTPNH